MTSLFAPNHPLLAAARSGYRLPETYTPWLDRLYPPIALILAVVFVLMAQLGGGVIAVILMLLLTVIRNGNLPALTNEADLVAALTPNDALENTLFLIFAFAPLFLILAGWVFLFEKRTLVSLGLGRPNLFFNYGRGVLVGWLMFTLAIAISGALGYLAWELDETQQQGLAALGGVLMIALGWIVQGAGEEILTRGWLLPVISSRYNTYWGIFLSSSLFAALHLLNPNVSLIAMLNIFLFGVFTCLYALYEGNLWGVFAIHSVWNWAQGNFYGFEVSGNSATGVTVFNLMEVGPDEITGGAFGPEGGLAVTAILLLGCMMVLIASYIRSEPNMA